MAPLNTGEQLWKNLQNLLASPSNEDPSGIFTADELIRLRMVYQGQTYEQSLNNGQPKNNRSKK
ncbi:MAG: hypothetical protein INR69_05600 [Mucilaginibacter polytrichastri]|nr:hypothetical protein [Mucilaginibacter polytrichastri]